MCLLSTRDLDWQPRASPFRQPDVEAPRLQSTLAEQADGVVGVDAIRTAAISDDLLALRQRRRHGLELRERRRYGAWNVARLVLALGADIEDDDLAAREPLLELGG